VTAQGTAAGEGTAGGLDPVAGAPATPRGRRTWATLVQAGREVFEEQGFDNTRIDHVVSRAGVSHGTFYTWFDSKEALLREVVRTAVEDLFTASRVGPLADSDAYTRIEEANRRYLRAVSVHSRILRVLDAVAETREDFRALRVQVREGFVTRGMEGLERLQARGLADPTLPPRATASALGAMVESFAHLWQDPVEGLDEDAAVDVLTRLWAGAIGLRRDAWPDATAGPDDGVEDAARRDHARS
jgi:AcrR family transcriptional regulator